MLRISRVEYFLGVCVLSAEIRTPSGVLRDNLRPDSLSRHGDDQMMSALHTKDDRTADKTTRLEEGMRDKVEHTRPESPMPTPATMKPS